MYRHTSSDPGTCRGRSRQVSRSVTSLTWQPSERWRSSSRPQSRSRYGGIASTRAASSRRSSAGQDPHSSSSSSRRPRPSNDVKSSYGGVVSRKDGPDASRSSKNPPISVGKKDGKTDSPSQRSSRSVTRKITPSSFPTPPIITRPVPRTFARPRSRSYSADKYGFPKDHDNKDAAFNEKFIDNNIVVYTDGSCSGRGCGIGVYFGEGHPLNDSKRVHPENPNSSVVEMMAAKQALKSLLSWREYNSERVVVRTDSLDLVVAMRNKDRSGMYTDILDLALRFPNGVDFQHVYGHSGDPGNEKADNLAREAVGIYYSTVVKGRSRSEEQKRSLYCPGRILRVASVERSKRSNDQGGGASRSTSSMSTSSLASSGYQSDDTAPTKPPRKNAWFDK